MQFNAQFSWPDADQLPAMAVNQFVMQPIANTQQQVSEYVLTLGLLIPGIDQMTPEAARRANASKKPITLPVHAVARVVLNEIRLRELYDVLGRTIQGAEEALFDIEVLDEPTIKAEDVDG